MKTTPLCIPLQMLRRQLLMHVVLLALITSTSIFAQKTITVDASILHQTIHGFGASDAWNADYVGKHWHLATRNDIAKKLFSQEFKINGDPEGIGLSRWRFNIGAGSAEQGTASNIEMEERRVECFLNEDSTYNWNKQAGQQWFLEQAHNYGVEHPVAFLNSPPRFYTKNGRTNSNNTNRNGPTNLKDNHYGLFADFMVTVLKYFNDKGLPFSQISPVNEPQYEWNSGQEGCPWTNADIKQLAVALNNAIIREGLDTKILLAEAASYDYMHQVSGDANKSDQIWKFFNATRPEYLGNLPQVLPGLAGHSYWTDNSDSRIIEARANILRESREQGNIELYQTEYNLLSRHFSDKLTNTIFLAKMIHSDLSIANMSIWDYWTAMERERWSQLNRFYLVRLRPSGGDYGSLSAGGSVVYDKNMWALGNYSLFVRPGYRRIGTTGADDLNGLMTTAYMAPDTSRMVMVYVNWSETAETVNHQFQNIPEGYRIGSITPYITNAQNNLAVKPEIADNEPYLITARSVTTLVIQLEPTTTGIRPSAEGQLTIFPNPASKKITVRTPELHAQHYTLNDMQGKRILEGQINSMHEDQIDISQVPGGWYVLQVGEHSKRLLVE